MYLLEIDSKKNRIHLTLSEQFNKQEAEALMKETLGRIEEMKQDFHVLCDLTSLREFHPEARTHFRSMMDLMNTRGAQKIIRIVPDPLNNFGLTVMSYFHYDNNVHVITCKSLEEALEHL